MRERGAFPPVLWTAVALGLVVALAIALVVAFLGGLIDPALASLAPFSGIAVGGFLAGNRAKSAPLYHGALVAAGYVLLEGIGIAPAPFAPRENALEDSIGVIVTDAALLALAALAAFLASRAASASSADKGRGR
jgi:hypothetical protein